MKTWFITGASRGFGALFVKEAFDRGDNVVATARNPQASQRNSVRVPTSLRSS
jgi:NAD(P)-dependent dehydrogenase (short-subunit alcohol dehydrogenase family)